jgi:single-strand DNA-binding protein
MNRVILAGNITRDPEGRRTNSGTSVCSFSIAVNRKYKAQEQTVEEVTYVDCEAWAQPADFVRDFMRKGDAILVEGRLKLDSWEDRSSGQKRSKLKVVAERVESLTTRNAQPQPDLPHSAPPFPSNGGYSGGHAG